MPPPDIQSRFPCVRPEAPPVGSPKGLNPRRAAATIRGALRYPRGLRSWIQALEREPGPQPKGLGRALARSPHPPPERLSVGSQVDVHGFLPVGSHPDGAVSEPNARHGMPWGRRRYCAASFESVREQAGPRAGISKRRDSDGFEERRSPWLRNRNPHVGGSTARKS